MTTIIIINTIITSIIIIASREHQKPAEPKQMMSILLESRNHLSTLVLVHASQSLLSSGRTQAGCCVDRTYITHRSRPCDCTWD